MTASKRRHDPFCVRAECDQNSRSRNKQRENTQRAATNLGTSNLSVCFFRLPTPCAPPRVHGVSPAQPVLLPCPLSAGSPPDCLVGIPLVALAAHPHAPSSRVVILDGDGGSAAGAPSGIACARVLFLEVLAMTVYARRFRTVDTSASGGVGKRGGGCRSEIYVIKKSCR